MTGAMKKIALFTIACVVISHATIAGSVSRPLGDATVFMIVEIFPTNQNVEILLPAFNINSAALTVANAFKNHGNATGPKTVRMVPMNPALVNFHPADPDFSSAKINGANR